MRAITQTRRNVFQNVLRKQREELKHERELYKLTLESTADSFYKTQPEFKPFLGPDAEGYVSIGDGIEAFYKYTQPQILPKAPHRHAPLGLWNYILGFKRFKAKYSPAIIIIFLLALVSASYGVNPGQYAHLLPGSGRWGKNRERWHKTMLPVKLEHLESPNKQAGGSLNTSEEIEEMILEITDGREVLTQTDINLVINALIEKTIQ
jgi:hypothetical protein